MNDTERAWRPVKPETTFDNARYVNETNHHHKPYGLLNPLPIPDYPWQSLAMDFITSLPKSNGFDSILTITARLTKMVHLSPMLTTATTEDVANVFIKHVIRLHGVPTSIVSDRDPKFCSNSGSR